MDFRFAQTITTGGAAVSSLLTTLDASASGRMFYAMSGPGDAGTLIQMRAVEQDNSPATADVTQDDGSAAQGPVGAKFTPRAAAALVAEQPEEPQEPSVTEEHDCTEGHDNGPPPLMSGGAGVLRQGDSLDDALVGTAGDDTLDGGAGADHLIGGDGIDVATYASADRRVVIDLQNTQFTVGDAVGDTYESIEIFRVSAFNDQLRGDAGNNILMGGNSSDRLYGRAGDDILNGENGVDALYGNRGADTLTGGGDPEQRDRFIYFDEADSTPCPRARDTITDFVSGVDRIEISRLDADLSLSGNQAFDFIGDNVFSNTAGELRYTQDGGSTVVQADMDGDGAADFEIELLGTMALVAEDFLL